MLEAGLYIIFVKTLPKKMKTVQQNTTKQMQVSYKEKY